MKRRARVALFALMMPSAFIAGGCNATSQAVSKDPRADLIGQWVSDSSFEGFSQLEFFDDGTYTSNLPNGKGGFSVSGNRLKLDGYMVSDTTCDFRIENGNLYLGNGKGVEFHRP